MRQFQEKNRANQVLKRKIQSNDAMFEEILADDNLERECIEQACQQEEFLEAYDNIVSGIDPSTSLAQFYDYVKFDKKEFDKNFRFKTNSRASSSSSSGSETPNPELWLFFKKLAV